MSYSENNLYKKIKLEKIIPISISFELIKGALPFIIYAQLQTINDIIGSIDKTDQEENKLTTELIEIDIRKYSLSELKSILIKNNISGEKWKKSVIEYYCYRYISYQTPIPLSFIPTELEQDPRFSN